LLIKLFRIENVPLVNRKRYNIRYPSVKTNHPFYILVLGRYSQVKQYFDKIKSESQNTGLNFPAENFVIFSTQIFEKPALLQINVNEQPIPSSSSPTSDNPQKLGIRRVEVINDGQIVMKKVENPQNVERLIIPSQTSNNIPKETSLKYTLKYSSLPYTLPLANSASYQLNGDSDFNNNTKEFKKLDPQSSLIPLQLTNWQFTDNQLEFNALINLDNNPQGIGVYRLIFDVFSEKFLAHQDRIKPRLGGKIGVLAKTKFLQEIELIIYNPFYII